MNKAIALDLNKAIAADLLSVAVGLGVVMVAIAVWGGVERVVKYLSKGG